MASGAQWFPPDAELVLQLKHSIFLSKTDYPFCQQCPVFLGRNKTMFGMCWRISISLEEQKEAFEDAENCCGRGVPSSSFCEIRYEAVAVLTSDPCMIFVVGSPQAVALLAQAFDTTSGSSRL